jgi:hypothetical protein
MSTSLPEWTAYIDAISARDADTGMVSIQVAMYSHTVPALPPLIKEKAPVLNMASQVAMITHVSPRIDTLRKARCIHQQINTSVGNASAVL